MLFHGTALASDAQQNPHTSAFSRCSSDSSVRIYFLDVGQGDAAILQIPNGKVLVVDGGPGRTQLHKALTQLRIDTVTLMIASHNHADHIAGFNTVLRTKTVLAYMENGVPSTTSTYMRLADLLRRKRTRVLAASRRTIDLDGLQVRILPPSRLDKSQNNNSIGLEIAFGAFTILFMGDAEHTQLAFWIRNRLISKSHVLKVGHHGSSNAISNNVVSTIHPSVAIISVANKNAFGHPSAKTIKSLHRQGVHIYRTDRGGTVILCASRNGTFTVSSRHPLTNPTK